MHCECLEKQPLSTPATCICSPVNPKMLGVWVCGGGSESGFVDCTVIVSLCCHAVHQHTPKFSWNVPCDDMARLCLQEEREWEQEVEDA